MRNKKVVRSVGRLLHILSSMLQSIGGSTALGLVLQLNAGDWAGAVTHTIDPLQYEDPRAFQQDYLATNLVRKLASFPGLKAEERAEAALLKYVQCEDSLSVSDRRLSALYRGAPSVEPLISDIMSMSREKIRSWLGPFCWAEWAEHARFGPGSSSSVRGRDVSVFEKMSKPSVDTTRALLPLAECFLINTRWGDHVTEIANREFVDVITVPKTALVDRTIGVEPDLNIFFQLGIGGMIRNRLKRVNCDLDNGWLRNADLARKGSIDGSLATVDLSSASDRISYKLVRELLPEDWFAALCRTRSPYAKVGEFPFLLRKFSSMGNGFTFELESMIFYALTLSCAQSLGAPCDDIAVFGDDIICPTEVIPTLYHVFRFLGFQVNETKSYCTGYFRESCGAHFFKGWNCKPIYVKTNLTDEESIYKLANATRRLSFRMFGVDIHHTRLLPAYRCIVSYIRPGRLCRIPDGYGDGGLCSSFDEVVPHLGSGIRRLGNGFEGYVVKALSPVPGRVKRSDSPAFIGVLFNLHRRKLQHSRLRFGQICPDLRTLIVSGEPIKFSDDDGNIEYAPRSSDAPRYIRNMVVPVWIDPGENRDVLS